MNKLITNDELPTLYGLAKFVASGMPEAFVKSRVAHEISLFEMLYQQSPELQRCTKDSLLRCMREIILDGLTVAPEAGQVYLIPFNIDTGKGYITVCKLQYSINTLIAQCIMARLIDAVLPPEIVKNEDGSVKEVIVKFKKDNWCEIIVDTSQFERLKKMSTKVNKGKPNPLYTAGVNGTIDEGFAKAKALRIVFGKLASTAKTLMRVHPQFIDNNEVKEFIPSELVKNEASENFQLANYSVVVISFHLLF